MTAADAAAHPVQARIPVIPEADVPDPIPEADAAAHPVQARIPVIPEADVPVPIPGADVPVPIPGADVPDLTPEADAAAHPEAAQIPEADLHVPDRAQLPDAETRTAARAIRIKTADPERIRSITRTIRTSPARTEPDASSVPKRRKQFPLRSRSRQSLFPRRFPSAIWRSACTFRLPRSSRNSSCRAR
jgi:hypothetical protein